MLAMEMVCWLLPRSEGDGAVLLVPMADCLFLAAAAPVSLPIFEPHSPTSLVISVPPHILFFVIYFMLI